MREEKGNSPKNARIKIDYSKNKPKVNFSYPSKNNQREGSMFIYIFMIMIILCFIFLQGMIYISDNIDNKNNNHNQKQLNLSNYNFSNYESFLDYIDDSNLLNNTFYKINNKKTENKSLNLIDPRKGEEAILFWLFILPYILSLIIYLPFKNYWKNIYPKFQGLTSRKKITIFKKEDIMFSQKENKYYCELPVFNNVILDYKATNDFSKYLELFEIREHKFKYYSQGIKRLKNKLNKTKSEKRKKQLRNRIKSKELNEWIWYARFYFKEKPIKGVIEVLYH